MNPNNYNAYGYPQFNVGSGWSSNNNNFPMNNQPNMNQGQDFKSSEPPPPIGFVIPDTNQNNIPQYENSQPNIGYNQYTAPVGTPGQNIDVYQTNSCNQPAPESNVPIYQTQTRRDINQYDPNISKNRNHDIYENQKNPTQSVKQEITSQHNQKQYKNASNNDNKSEYQKGLDKLAELMNEDLTPEELKKLTK